jgi:hypothetical protein
MGATKIITKKEKGANRHWKNFLAKDYLGSHNLEAGEEMLLTIARFEGEEMVNKVDGKKDEKVPKPVLYFKENVPKMILNITNGTTIANLYGTHPDAWIGKQIQIYAAEVRAFGKTQDALRIRDFKPKFDVDATTYTAKLDQAKDQAELLKIFRTFPQSAQNDAAIKTHASTLKAKLNTPPA